MKKAKVYFIELSDADYRNINCEGWDSDIGKKYLAARDGKDADSDFYKLAAEVETDSPEFVWAGLQNIDTAWTERAPDSIINIVKLGDAKKRSMDIGDKIVWEDGKIEIVANVGFKEVKGAAA